MTHIISGQDKGLKTVEKKQKGGTLHLLLRIVYYTWFGTKITHAGKQVLVASASQTLVVKQFKNSPLNWLRHVHRNFTISFFLKKLRQGNKFTAEFFDSRKGLFSASTFLGQIVNKSKVVSLRGGAIPPQARRGKCCQTLLKLPMPMVASINIAPFPL